jgi:hypothetical protein
VKTRKEKEGIILASGNPGQSIHYRAHRSFLEKEQRRAPQTRSIKCLGLLLLAINYDKMGGVTIQNLKENNDLYKNCCICNHYHVDVCVERLPNNVMEVHTDTEATRLAYKLPFIFSEQETLGMYIAGEGLKRPQHRDHP